MPLLTADVPLLPVLLATVAALLLLLLLLLAVAVAVAVSAVLAGAAVGTVALAFHIQPGDDGFCIVLITLEQRGVFFGDELDEAHFAVAGGEGCEVDVQRFALHFHAVSHVGEVARLLRRAVFQYLAILPGELRRDCRQPVSAALAAIGQRRQRAEDKDAVADVLRLVMGQVFSSRLVQPDGKSRARAGAKRPLQQAARTRGFAGIRGSGWKIALRGKG